MTAQPRRPPSYLGAEGFEIELAHDGRTGFARALEGAHDLVALDVMLDERGRAASDRQLRGPHAASRSDSSVVMAESTASGIELLRCTDVEA